MNCQGIGRILGHNYDKWKPVFWYAPSGGRVYRVLGRVPVPSNERMCTRCGHIVNAPKEQA